MVRRTMNPPTDGWSLTVPPKLWMELEQHLFRADDDEHGAVILAEQTPGRRGPRLLARELMKATDEIDYVPGTTGYRALSPEFVRDAAVRARDLGMAYLAIHNHFGTNRVAFSHVDLDSHERGYPALRQIVGQVVGAVVLAPDAAAGDLWLPDGRRVALAEVVIPSNNLIRLQPQPLTPKNSDSRYDRQARLFGDRGQATFGRLRVAVAGLGGVGSILTELLARLGVGSLALIDDDVAEVPNLPRLVGASFDDVDTLKTALAARNARRANPRVEVIEISEGVETPTARQTLETCDWIFLAADTAAARHYVNATVHQYLIPTTQVGVKVPVNDHGEVGQIHAVTRLLLPGVGCLWCNGLIDATELAIDLHPEEERRQARYVAGVEAPSVIALNCLAAAEATDHFMLAVTGLHTDEHDHSSVLHRPRSRDRDLIEPSQAAGCPACVPHSKEGTVRQSG